MLSSLDLAYWLAGMRIADVHDMHARFQRYAYVGMCTCVCTYVYPCVSRCVHEYSAIVIQCIIHCLLHKRTHTPTHTAP
jgi:hypothetical protein